MAGKFSADVARWAAEAERRSIEVVRASAELAAENMTRPRGAGGHMPVDSGNLRNSLAASLAGRVTIDWSKDRTFTERFDIPNVLKAAQPGHTIFLGFRAPYAEKVEFGASGGFWRAAVQRWPAIVAEAVRRVKR